jgi:hypothetical protein
MNILGKFTTGLITGGIIGAVGLGYALSDKRTRKRMVRDSKKAMDKANSVIENISGIAF